MIPTLSQPGNPPPSCAAGEPMAKGEKDGASAEAFRQMVTRGYRDPSGDLMSA